MPRSDHLGYETILSVSQPWGNLNLKYIITLFWFPLIPIPLLKHYNEGRLVLQSRRCNLGTVPGVGGCTSETSTDWARWLCSKCVGLFLPTSSNVSRRQLIAFNRTTDYSLGTTTRVSTLPEFVSAVAGNTQKTVILTGMPVQLD